MNTLKKTAVAFIAVTTVAMSSMAATTTAQAKNKFVKGLIVGGIATAVIGAASRGHAHSHGYRECWTERERRFDRYGDPYWVRVKYCN